MLIPDSAAVASAGAAEGKEVYTKRRKWRGGPIMKLASINVEVLDAEAALFGFSLPGGVWVLDAYDRGSPAGDGSAD